MRIPPPTDELPDAGYADAVFTVVTLRTAAVTGLVAGAIVPFIPLAILVSAGLFGTFLFNRGTIYQTMTLAISPANLQIALKIYVLVLLGSIVLGAVMGTVRRWSVRRYISWPLLVGHIFSTHPGPHTLIAVLAVPLLIAAALHRISLDVGYLVSIAPVLFFMFPLWSLSGFIYEAVWEPIVFLVLRVAAGEPMTWLRREAALVQMLKDDSELFGCRLHAARIDTETGVAYIRADFRTPDHFRRAREIGMRVIGVRDVAAEGLTVLESESAKLAEYPDRLIIDGEHTFTRLYLERTSEVASMPPHQKALQAVRTLWQALILTVFRTSRNGGHDSKER